MQAEVLCKVIATEILDKALDGIDFTSPQQHWSSKKEDNRKTNKGASKRTSRTWQFKKKMILEAEKMAALHPEEATQATTFVAMIFNIGRSQITDWKRARTAIFKNAKGIKRNNTKAYKLRKGRFPACEAVVFEEFQDVRTKGKQVGPKWLRQRMRREVAKQQPMGWRLFTSSCGWLWRFTKRFKIVIRRKTNTKREPIEKRVPKLKRWFATKRLFLLSKKGKRGYCDKWSIYPRGNRWCLDQVPIGLFDPKTTYENKGADHVHIASNGTADGHRIGTAQVLCRNAKKDPSLPRHGQPRMCLAFRGKGLRIKQEEMDQYHKDVVVQFQPCAWYDSVLSNKWVVEVAKDDILKKDAKLGKRHLLNCDNLSSQTVKTNPQFSKLLGDLCNCDVFNGCAGNTDEIQVVDAGVGALLKRFAEEIQTEWLDDDDNWNEWQEASLPAGRKRVLLTLWYGQAWERVCERFDFEGVFDKCGSSLTADGSEDDRIKLQKLDSFSFDLNDAKRLPTTGEFPAPEAIEDAIVVRATDNDDDDFEEIVQDHGSAEEPSSR